MVENAAKAGPPVVTTAILQVGLVAQMLCEADRTIGYVTGLDPVFFLPEAYPGEAFIISTFVLTGLLGLNFILLMIWLFKANRFIGSQARPALNFSPGWAVGCWFIPLANLLAPFMAMTELFNASRAPAAWKARRPPVLAVIWWGAELVGIAIALFGRFGGRFGFDVPPQDLMNAGVYGAGTLRLLCLLVLVTLIVRFQKAAAVVDRAGGIENVF